MTDDLRDEPGGQPWWASTEPSGTAEPGPWDDLPFSDEPGERARRAEPASAAALIGDLTEMLSRFLRAGAAGGLGVDVAQRVQQWTTGAMSAEASETPAGDGDASGWWGDLQDAPDLDDVTRHVTVDACGICPLCTLIKVVGDGRGEAVEHLATAVRHLALAAKAVIEQVVEGPEDRGMTRIHLDDD